MLAKVLSDSKRAPTISSAVLSIEKDTLRSFLTSNAPWYRDGALEWISKPIGRYTSVYASYAAR